MTHPHASDGYAARSVGVRIVLLVTLALGGPWLMGAMAAYPPAAKPAGAGEVGEASEASDQIELSGQGGQYVFTPVCSSRAMQVRHVEAQARWTHRGEPEAAWSGTLVTHVDLATSYNVKTEAEKASPAATSDNRDSKDIFYIGRLQAGIDWTFIGMRLGLSAIGASSTAQRSNANGVALTATSTSQTVLPAGSLRIGSKQVHVRLALADGTWQLRPTALTLGVGVADGGSDPNARRNVQGFVGLGADISQASDRPFIYSGIRMDLRSVKVGLQGRAGPDGLAVGAWLGLPL